VSGTPDQHSANRGASGGTLSRAGMLWVTTFGLGFMRPASGTWGSMPTVAAAGLMIFAGFAPVWGTSAWWVYHGVLVAILIVFSVGCVIHGAASEVRFGKKDPGQVVADETAGQALALMALPERCFTSPWHVLATLGAAFIAFRLFDIVKPWPARGLQRHPAGWGILLDDLASGVQAMIVVQVLTRWVM